MNQISLGSPYSVKTYGTQGKPQSGIEFALSSLSIGERSPIQINKLKNSLVNTSKKMEVSQIRFTQATVSPYFSDGSSVAELSLQLSKGEMFAYGIDAIRVVRYKNQFWSLDNRRLRAFKDGLVTSVEVILVDLKDTAIAKEFWSKKTSKSAEAGIIRKEHSEASKTQYCDNNGMYDFNRKVLNWTFEQINEPMPAYKKIPLQDLYDNRDAYYKSFENLIFEEARAILQTGLQQAELKEKHPYSFTLSDLKVANRADNPSEMKFKILADSERDLKAGDILLLEHKKFPKLRLIVWTSYSPLTQENNEISVRVVLNEDIADEFSHAFEDGDQWRAKPLGSLVTLQRMYEACITLLKGKPIALEEYIIAGKSDSSESFEESSEEKEIFPALNPSQNGAVNAFRKLDKGYQIIQGPPGTGKTTTVIQLLAALNEKILVCAPSNKAVHILAERFMAEFPEVPIMLIGVEQKLPSDSILNTVFLDTWCSRQIHFLTEMRESLWKFKPEKLAEGNIKFLPKRIEQARENLSNFVVTDFYGFIDEVEKYQLTCLGDLQKPLDQLVQATFSYCELINSQEICWEEIAYYASQKDEKTPLPKSISIMLPYLTEVSIILSSLEEKLRKAQSDQSAKGLEAQLINHSQIIFATLSVSGQQRLKVIESIDTLIIDEAGQAPEAEALIAMKTNPKKCLLIGDIQQLDATVISQDAEKLKFGRSMMERLMLCGHPYWMLKTQYRMHPEICSWPSRQYYQNELKNDASVSVAEYTLGIDKELPFLAPYAFINIDGREAVGQFGNSFINQAEADSVEVIVNYLAEKQLIKVEERVAIISFYAGQVKSIYETLKVKYPKIKVNTVDGFQGGENDIVIISCVRANFNKQIGFLKESKRLNVALTRAKFSLIILGNQSTLMRSDIAELVEDAKERKLLFDQSVLEKLKPKIEIAQPHWKQNSSISRKEFSAKSKPSSNKLIRSDYKTQLCRHYAMGYCERGNSCSFAHERNEQQRTPKSFNSKNSSTPRK